jgi:magnesium transporter
MLLDAREASEDLDGARLELAPGDRSASTAESGVDRVRGFGSKTVSSLSCPTPLGRSAPMIVDCAHYVRGSRVPAALTLEQAMACPRSGSSFVWLELHEPDELLMTGLREGFHLHELAVEDASRAHQRPKVEAYEGFYFLVFKTARYHPGERRLEIGELDLFLGSGFVIAVRHGEAAELGPVRARLEQRRHLLKSGPAAVVWGILDALVDDYGPVVEGLEADIEDVERMIFADREDATERIYFLKQEVGELYRAVHPLLEPLARVQAGAFEQMDPRLRGYFRDVTDHLLRVHEEVVAQREQLASALDANVSLMSVRQNEIAARQNVIAKQLTIVATVFLPLTFITGFFGQNFGWLTGHVNTFLDFVVLGIGAMLIPCVVLLAWFKRSHYI